MAGSGVPSLADLPDTLAGLLDTGARIGRSLLESMGGQGSNLKEFVDRSARRSMGGCCEVPPPCWMPQELGRAVSHVCPGGSASVRFRITNCGIGTDTVRVEPAGKTVQISVDPTKLALGPMEEGSIDAMLSVPADASNGDTLEALLWVRGCRDHYLRWVVKIGGGGCCDSLHEVSVDDCPDLIHHWYDHFYCARPCVHGRLGHDG